MTGPESIRPIILNGAKSETAAASLSGLLVEKGYGGAKVATAVNGAFVPEKERAQTSITAGDRIEVVSARQGG